ncbi:MAG: DUF962 domain-containing protein [Betaproteobacteria bacterium]|nr:MAG: DUF962 domain-containing protein [Betaproteobacteria bacterium]TMH69323.1 MAG: DUF962 domain-containing protein [Betaproteobacteria bacterium]
MRKIDELFGRYGESHRNPTNKAIHWICVPLITWSLLAALWAWTPLAVYVLIALAVVFYISLSLPIAIGMLVVSALMVLTLTIVTEHLLTLALVVFVIAWIGQFIGHKIEGKKPSFFEDIKFLLIGPAWLLGFVYRRLGIAY